MLPARSFRPFRPDSRRIAQVGAAGLLVCTLTFSGGCAGGGEDEPTRSRYADAPLPPGPVGLYTEGVLARKAGDREQAVRLLTQAIRRDDQLIMANRVLGELLQEQQDWENAAHYFRRLVERDPETADSHFRLAFSLEQLRAYTDAVRSYLAGLSIKENDFAGNLGAGRTYLALGDAAEARSYLETATDLRPESDDAWLNLARALDQTQAYADAEAAYRRAIEASPSPSPDLLEGLAMSLVYQQDASRAAEAVALLEQVVEENPTNRSRERLGLAYAIAGEFQKAQEQFDRVLEDDPRNVSALNSQGTAYFLQYRSEGSLDDSLRQKALEAWGLSLKVDPDQREVRQTYEAVSGEEFLR